MIIGCCGAGKSTLAKQIHQELELELIHLDAHFWLPGWEEESKDAWEQKVRDLASRPTWIIDGNYSGTFSLRFERADMVIFLDRSRWLCLYRVIKRVVKNYGQTRSDMAADCPERWSWEFMHYVFTYNWRKRPKVLRLLDQLRPAKQVVHLRSDRAVQDFVNSLSS